MNSMKRMLVILMLFVCASGCLQINNSNTVIIGVTNKHISTAKEGNVNWGVMGLGYCPGASCVISTYRVKGSSKSIDHFRDRITKLALHELGHTFGAPHCRDRDCIMKDAEGKMNLDKARVYCDGCRTKIMCKM